MATQRSLQKAKWKTSHWSYSGPYCEVVDLSSIDLALIGCGGVSRHHVHGLGMLRERGFETIGLRAVCDLDEGRARERAAQAAESGLGEVKVYTDFRAMLEGEPELDAVDVCTDHRSHHAVVVPCLEAGKDVLVEKPLGITMRACRAMVEAARRSGRVLAVAENYRRSLVNRVIRWVIDRGMIGDPRFVFWLEVGYRLGVVVGTPWRHDRLRSGGGWVLDGGVHTADLLMYWLGRVEEVYALTRTYEPTRYLKWPEREGPVKSDVEDTSMAILKFKSGVVGEWTWTTVAPGERLGHHVIHGTLGSIGREEGLVTTAGKKQQKATPLQSLSEEMVNSLSGEERSRLFPGGIGLRPEERGAPWAVELWDFADALLHSRKPEVDGVMGLRAEAVPMAIYESSRLGGPVEVARVERCEVENYQREINEALGIS